jgi:DNA primase
MNKLLINKNTQKPNKILKETNDSENKIEINNVIDHHERECVRMLVNYGKSDFEILGLDRKSFIEYFLREIEDVDFTNKSYIKIIKTFKEEFQQNNIIDINHFLSEKYNDIKNDVIDLSTSKYEISSKWKEKFNIHVTDESDSLKKTTYNNILRLKFRLIKKMINDNLKNLGSDSETYSEEEIINTHNKLKSAEMEIAKQLGNVTSI